MYIIRFLSYPFLDNKDSSQVYTISKDDFLYKSSKIDNNIIGVNCLYEAKIPIPPFYKDYFIINLDKNVTIYFNGENITNSIINNAGNIGGGVENEPKSEILKLAKFITYSIDENRKDPLSFLESKIKGMHSTLFQTFRTVVYNNNNDKNTNINISNSSSNINEENSDELYSLNFFKELELTENNYKNFPYNYNEYNEYNDILQKVIYSFNLTIYELFHDTIKLVMSEGKSNKDGTKNYYYQIQFDLFNTYRYVDEEKLFFKYFMKTSKYDQFVNLFLKSNNCPDLNRPSMICAEEFMNIKKALTKDDNKDYIQMINNFYQTSQKVVKIDFNPFYIYYSDNLVKTIYNSAIGTKIIKLTHETKNNITKTIFRQKEILLDDNILKRYVYILNNLEKQEYMNIFPTLKFKLVDNCIQDVDTTYFADLLETSLLEDKFYSIDEIVAFIILIVYIVSLKRNKIIFHFFEEIIRMEITKKRNDSEKDVTKKQELGSTTFRKTVLRKYVYIILSILNEKVREKMNRKENFIKELLLYKEVMNCILDANNKSKDSRDKCYYPNERLGEIINNFNIYQKEYQALVETNPDFENFSKKVIKKYNSGVNAHELEDGVDYKVLLQNNACRDKGAIKDDVLIKISEALEYKGLIQTTCKTCQLRIRPNLFFIHVPIDKASSTGFYSICYSYKNAFEILKNALNNNVTDKNNDELFNVIANMIFYINFKCGINNKISNYLATCLI
jgi:hypothetical protein